MATTQKNNSIHNRSSVYIATFAPYENGKRLPTNGMVEPMVSFFLPRAKNLLLLVEPHSGSDFIEPVIEDYTDKTLIETRKINKFFYLPVYWLCQLQNDGSTHISFKLRDFFSVLFIGLFRREKFDYFIGLESINTLAGIVLKRFGIIKTVIYYVSDYSPTRFGKTLFNTVYLWLDRFCVTHSNIIWDVSPAIQKARVAAGLNPEKSAPVIHVPNALFSSQIKSLPIEKRIPYSLVFMGSLGFENGPDLAIESLAEIRKKFPKAMLHIIGGGKQNLERLKILTTNLNLEKAVIFYGFVVDNNEMAKLVRRCYIALAPYRAIPYSVRWYADATKIRQYLASGLPVVTTQVPPLGKEVARKGAALVAKDTTESFAQTIIQLLNDPEKYKQMEQLTRELSRENIWEIEYQKAFETMREKYSL